MKITYIAVVAATLTINSSLIGQAGSLQFDGSPTRLEVDPSPALNPTTGMTIEAWAWSDPTNTSQATIARHLGAEAFIFRERSNRIEFVLNTTTTGQTIFAAPVGVPAAQWVHLAGTYDGTTMRIYRDGVEVLSSPKSGPLQSVAERLRLGSGNGSGSEYWIGRLDEIRYWDYARTGDQIRRTQFAQLRNRPGLIGAWSFNDQSFQDADGNFVTRSFGTPVFSSSVPPIAGLVSSPALAPIGTTVTFDLFSVEPGVPFIFDVSLTGTTPGLPIDPRFGPLPLNPPLLNLEFGSLVPGVFDGFLGFFDVSGLAQTRVHLPVDPSLIGLDLSGAFVVIDPSQTSFVGDVSDHSTTRITSDLPQITSLMPNRGPAAGGTTVQMQGLNFQPGMQLLIGGSPVSGLNVMDSMTATFQTPGGNVGPADIRLENPDGNTIQLPAAYTYVTTLALSQVNPLAPTAGGVVRVVGSGFQPGLTMEIDGQAVNPASVSPTEVVFVHPSGVGCDGTLRIDNPDGQSVSTVINPSPTVTTAVAAAGPVSGGTQFFIFGQNFFLGTTVSIGGTPAPVVSATEQVLLVLVPAGQAPGAVPIVVTGPTGCPNTGTVTYLYR